MCMKLVKDTERVSCSDCAVKVGEEHQLGCDIERCPKCGTQLISCGCFTIDIDDGAVAEWDIASLSLYKREKWSGVSYEKEMLYCEEHNLWVKWINNGWENTTIDDPNRTHDINTATIKMHHR
ncbi:MAG: hypothetical protein ACC656_11400 [Candidatus Heimdallarchaeota archaeon]